MPPPWRGHFVFAEPMVGEIYARAVIFTVRQPWGWFRGGRFRVSVRDADSSL